jgi:phage terminase large subunit-like protein
MEQLRFLLWWYAVDGQGRFVYRKGVLQRLKGWGKDPMGAVMCLVELVGPSRFSHFDENGTPIGGAHPSAWVQVAAVSQDQTRNTMALMPALISREFEAAYDIAQGAELIRARGGRVRLEAVTSSYRAIEGKRTTFTLLNETHHWVLGNQGHKMHETIDGNVTKMDSRYLAITNAYLPGEDSVAERMREAYEKVLEGRAADVGMLYDSIEAHPSTPLTPEGLHIVVPKIRGDAVWLNVDAIVMSVLDVTIPASRSRRMWLNQIVADEDALYTTANWDDNTDETDLKPGDEIVMGFDGGKTDDDTGLVAIRVSDQTAFVLLHEACPEGPAGVGWQVNKAKVDGAVHEAFRLYNVRAFYADVALWESYIDDWAEQYRGQLDAKASVSHAIAWDMRSSLQRSTLAHERLLQSILDGKVRNNGDRRLRRHILNARRRVNNYGVSFGKESRESPRKVDLYAALMLAHQALHDVRTRVPERKQRTGRGYFT